MKQVIFPRIYHGTNHSCSDTDLEDQKQRQQTTSFE